ncbi:MAG: diguanylate cyclase response regulator [Geobacteraceae bacterium GWC2_58_44]|nr:MAG: diguanylate cyclase response regulator [Geobacteraceae bacterium GWC2_58_44]HBG06400.1 diguanylate cyclase response regulator [Geobacter sp.]
MTRKDAVQRRRQRILIVDDTLANIEILHKILQADHDIFFAKSGADGVRIVKQEMPDLILLDIMMPDMDGYQVCALLKGDPQTAHIPVIFITAMGSDEDETRGLDCGAIDYITKPISPPIVKARVRNHLELKRSRDLLAELTVELGEKNRELEILAREDGLTGLANRRHFNEVLDAELKRALRTRQYLSLVLCDVDFFKKYNDQYGHVAGDKCLQAIGDVMRATFRRAGDLPARYGGEEFAAILPDTAPDQAVQLAERLRQELMARDLPHLVDGVQGQVTLSVGVVGVQATRERNAEWVIREADQALYRSKETGRNRVSAVAYD